MLAQGSEFRTPIHDVPVAFKFAVLLAACIILVFVSSLFWQAVFFATIASIYAVFGRSFLRAGIWALRPLIVFILFILILSALRGDMQEGAMQSLRLINIFALANLLTMTTRLDDMIDFLTRLIAPLKVLGVNTHAVAMTLAIAMRFLPVLRFNVGNLMQSWKARSRRHANWRVVTPIMLLALDDASRLADSLRARGGINAVRNDQ